MNLNIAVIGSGIIGLTSASQILEKIPNAKITIFYKDKSPNTTSDVSAGYWEPFCLNESPDQKALILKWGKETYDKLLKTAFSENNRGVQTISAYKIQNTDNLKLPFWHNIVSQFRELSQNDIASVCAKENLIAKSGYHFLTLTINVNKLMSELTNELKDHGVLFKNKELKTLNEFISEYQSNEYHYVINCTGLGAAKFCNDPNMVPVRGQLLKVKAPWIKNCLALEYELTYILPIDDCVFLGGTFNYNVDDINANDEDCKQILERCSKLMPSLKNSEIISKTTGLRPFRKNGIRLEMEIVQQEEKLTKVIHNYGHSGSGFTLMWGCATSVYELIEKDMSKGFC